MMLSSVRKIVAIIAIVCLTILSQAQPLSIEAGNSKPYKILTSGKQITVKSTKNIRNIMVWTASGHRIVEQKDVNELTFSFHINVSERVFFLMIQFDGSKPYTEKIGI
ncbi:MAG: hypothetical protein JNK14_08265 [Chitinophagaceae bacterium]|nr:hypothetical protein [Chitinophagaceae bacterium]